MRTHRNTVVSLGAGTAAAGRRYAGITGRKWAYVESEAALDCRIVAVLIATAARITPQLLERLYTAEYPDVAPGLILAPDGGRLDDVVGYQLTALASLDGDSHPVRPLVSISSHRPMETDTLRTIRKILQTDMELLWLSGHSDGIDASLPGGCVLCPIDEKGIGSSSSTCCGKTNYCFRLNRTTRDIFNHPRLFRASTLRATLVVAEICNGFLPAASSEEYENSLVWAVVRSGQTAAMAAPWATFIAAEDDFEGLKVAISDGVSIGQAVAAFNRRICVSNPGARLAVLGDPEVTVHARSNDAIWEIPSRLLTCPEREPALGDPSPPRHTVDQLLASGCAYHHLWFQADTEMGWAAPFSCEYCACPANRYTMRYGKQYRQLSICPMCGIISDAPTGGVRCRIEIVEEGFAAIANCHRGFRIVGVRVGCKDERLAQNWIVDIPVDCYPVGFRLLLDWPPGPIKISIVVTDGTRFAVFSRRYKNREFLHAQMGTVGSLKRTFELA